MQLHETPNTPTLFTVKRWTSEMSGHGSWMALCSGLLIFFSPFLTFHLFSDENFNLEAPANLCHFFSTALTTHWENSLRFTPLPIVRYSTMRKHGNGGVGWCHPSACTWEILILHFHEVKEGEKKKCFYYSHHAIVDIWIVVIKGM